MAEAKRLTALGVKALNAKGRYGDGGGLWLQVSSSGTKSWTVVYRQDGKQREKGLGRFPEVPLVEARRRALTVRADVAAGRKPTIGCTSDVPTFAEAAQQFIDANESGWRNAKHRQQWRNSLATYARPIAAMAVDRIEADDVLCCLQPIWDEKSETASRVRGRVERILDYAAVRGWRPRGANPAAWKGNLALALPKPTKLSRGHHPAMPWQDVSAFMSQLRERNGVAAQALAFTILTATRSGEVRGATWDEIDVDAGLWTVPAERMKAKRPHRVPLSSQSLEILNAVPRFAHTDLIFPGTKGELSDMTLLAVLRRMERNLTVHGFRSSFRDWVSEATDFQVELAEHCLAHTVGSATERAYARSDLLDKRRALMAAWGTFCVPASMARD